VFRSPTPQNDELADAVAADTYSPGYLGPGSYALLLPQDDEPEGSRERESSVASVESEHEMTLQYSLTKSIRHQLASDILSTFRDFTTIRELVLWYSTSNDTSFIPAQLQIDAINAMEPFVEKHNLRNSLPSPQLIFQILENSSRPLCIVSVSNPRDLQTVCSGDNLRFETIGYVLALAGLALAFGCALAPFNRSENRQLRERYVDRLLRASTACLQLCPMLSTVNDITVWLYYENFLFTTVVCGLVGM
jgi:hypothetical protein